MARFKLAPYRLSLWWRLTCQPNFYKPADCLRSTEAAVVLGSPFFNQGNEQGRQSNGRCRVAASRRPTSFLATPLLTLAIFWYYHKSEPRGSVTSESLHNE